jgi:hypothetical protein
MIAITRSITYAVTSRETAYSTITFAITSSEQLPPVTIRWPSPNHIRIFFAEYKLMMIPLLFSTDVTFGIEVLSDYYS